MSRVKHIFMATLLSFMSAVSFSAFASDNEAFEASKLSAIEAIDIATDKVAGQVTEVEFETKRDRAYYEVDVRVDDQKHEFKIDANSGEVFKSKMRAEKKEIKTQAVTMREAITTAENETQAKTKEADLKNKQGDSYYKIKTIKDKSKFKVKVDASSGEILEVKEK